MDALETGEREEDGLRYARMTAEVVSAYVENNPVPSSELQKLIADIHGALTRLDGGPGAREEEKLVPAVNPKRSVQKDYIVCLECGGKFKSLRRHLSAHHGLEPDEYRARWNLSVDYPMVAPSYAEQRSALAKSMGLGRKPGAKPKAKRKK